MILSKSRDDLLERLVVQIIGGPPGHLFGQDLLAKLKGYYRETWLYDKRIVVMGEMGHLHDLEMKKDHKEMVEELDCSVLL